MRRAHLSGSVGRQLRGRRQFRLHRHPGCEGPGRGLPQRSRNSGHPTMMGNLHNSGQDHRGRRAGLRRTGQLSWAQLLVRDGVLGWVPAGVNSQMGYRVLRIEPDRPLHLCSCPERAGRPQDLPRTERTPGLPPSLRSPRNPGPKSPRRRIRTRQVTEWVGLWRMAMESKQWRVLWGL